MPTNRSTRRTIALVGAGLLPWCFVVGCGADDSSPDSDLAGVDNPPVTSSATEGESEPTPVGETVSALTDTFDDDTNGWALPVNDQGSMEVTGGDFVWQVKEAGLRPHVIATTLGMAYDAGTLEMTDVTVTASVTPQRGAGAFGLFCREVPDTDTEFQWYEFVVRDGFSAIRLGDLAGNLEVIAEGEATVPLGEVAELEATCVDEGDKAALSLSLNGEELLTASVPDPLGNGVSGLHAYDATAETSDERLLLAWHDFSVEPAG